MFRFKIDLCSLILLAMNMSANHFGLYKDLAQILPYYINMPENAGD